MMAKLYWRVKRNGKWTWRPAAVIDYKQTNACTAVVVSMLDQEEEE
jgi:hypothetical protein